MSDNREILLNKRLDKYLLLKSHRNDVDAMALMPLPPLLLVPMSAASLLHSYMETWVLSVRLCVPQTCLFWSHTLVTRCTCSCTCMHAHLTPHVCCTTFAQMHQYLYVHAPGSPCLLHCTCTKLHVKHGCPHLELHVRIPATALMVPHPG